MVKGKFESKLNPSGTDAALQRGEKKHVKPFTGRTGNQEFAIIRGLCNNGTLTSFFFVAGSFSAGQESNHWQRICFCPSRQIVLFVLGAAVVTICIIRLWFGWTPLSYSWRKITKGSRPTDSSPLSTLDTAGESISLRKSGASISSAVVGTPLSPDEQRGRRRRAALVAVLEAGERRQRGDAGRRLCLKCVSFADTTVSPCPCYTHHKEKRTKIQFNDSSEHDCVSFLPHYNE